MPEEINLDTHGINEPISISVDSLAIFDVPVVVDVPDQEMWFWGPHWLNEVVSPFIGLIYANQFELIEDSDIITE